ncbi:bestrophin-like domain [Granulibacter bethesdensis]|uniref:bestrophin-like domain n=1 Tax=Granulibacter bethesdensis TaxID=364410 RepID=UPI00090C92B6|nr:DUF4239 domain-containing protein [Granulibacter bethesdensis]APH59057.1 Hypothetical protein GbCGDNIH7_0732 [Granulibacter bethesdensis]
MDYYDLMNFLAVALMFVVLLGAYRAGLWLRIRLPPHHRNSETSAVVHAVIGMLVTFGAIVLGLMVTSGKEAYDSLSRSVNEEAIQIVQFNRLLIEYRTDIADAQTLLKEFTAHCIYDFNDPAPKATAQAKRLMQMEAIVRDWTPKTIEKKRLQFELEERLSPLNRVHWQIISQSTSSISKPFYITLILWMLASFFIYGLNADFSIFISVALIVSAISICVALFVVMEMATPLGGVVAVSDAPFRYALQQIKSDTLGLAQ